jgi:hypothetical protein
MIRVVHPGSGFFFTYPGSRGQKSIGSRICNTEINTHKNQKLRKVDQFLSQVIKSELCPLKKKLKLFLVILRSF